MIQDAMKCSEVLFGGNVMRLRGKKGIRESLEIQQQQGTVVLNPKQYKGKWSQFFGNNNPIHVELGMGKGRFISEMSFRNQSINFIGVDKYDELILRASSRARDLYEYRNDHLEPASEGADFETADYGVFPMIASTDSKPSNLALVLFNVEYIEDIFDEGELERIYLHFSDPWPKTRHARRRLTHPRFVEKYTKFLNTNGEIHMKTDSLGLFEFSLNTFSDLGLRMSNIFLDFYREGVRSGEIMTEYEQKFVEQGLNIYRCEVIVGEEALERLKRMKQAQLSE